MHAKDNICAVFYKYLLTASFDTQRKEVCVANTFPGFSPKRSLQAVAYSEKYIRRY
jgi:hypothetical protein